jgi:ribosomal protein L29
VKKNALKTKPIDELLKLIEEKREALRVFRFGIAGSKVRNIRESRNLRKDVARALTAITAQKREAEAK